MYSKIFLGIIVFFVVAIILWKILAFVVRRRTVQQFESMIENAEFAEAKEMFAEFLDISPLLTVCNSFMLPVLFSDYIKFMHNSYALQNFYSELADLYLAHRPNFRHENLTAAGMYRHNNKLLSLVCLKRAEYGCTNPNVNLMACKIYKDISLGRSLNSGLRTLKICQNSEGKEKSRTANTMLAAQMLMICGISAGSLCSSLHIGNVLQELTAKQGIPVSICACAMLKAFVWDRLGLGRRGAEEIETAPDGSSKLPQILKTTEAPHFMAEAAAYMNMHVHQYDAALKALGTASPKQDIPVLAASCKAVQYQIQIQQMIYSCWADEFKTPDKDLLDLTLRNIKELAEQYSETAFVQLAAADSFMCAGKYTNALMYLERSQKLDDGGLHKASLYGLFEQVCVPSYAIDQSEDMLTDFSSQIAHKWMHFRLFGLESIAEAEFFLYMHLKRFDDASGLCRRCLRTPLLSESEQLLWQLKLAEALQKQNRSQEAEEVLKEAGRLLDYIRLLNNIDGEYIPVNNFARHFGAEENPSCFGSSTYHIMAAELLRLSGKPYSETQAELQKALYEHKSCLPALRLLAELVLANRNANPDTAMQVLCALNAYFSSVYDIELMTRLRAFLPQDRECSFEDMAETYKTSMTEFLKDTACASDPCLDSIAALTEHTQITADDSIYADYEEAEISSKANDEALKLIAGLKMSAPEQTDDAMKTIMDVVMLDAAGKDRISLNLPADKDDKAV